MRSIQLAGGGFSSECELPRELGCACKDAKTEQCDSKQRTAKRAPATLCSSPQSNRHPIEWDKDCLDGSDDVANRGSWSEPAQLPGEEGNSARGIECRVERTGPRGDGNRYSGWTADGEASCGPGSRPQHVDASGRLHFHERRPKNAEYGHGGYASTVSRNLR